VGGGRVETHHSLRTLALAGEGGCRLRLETA
jgi:hypothetical protein